jgi:anti-sigma factor RsiW
VTDCARFTRWLDDGMPAGGSAANEAHAAGCAGCAAALAGARALDRALERALAAAPDGFADRVMERVERARRVPLTAWIEPDMLPWWVRAAAEPAVVLATMLAALVLWQYPLLVRVATAAWRLLSGPAVSGFLRLPGLPAELPGLAMLTDPYVLVGLALAGLPIAWWAGLAVYHWSGDASPPGPRLHAGSAARH